MSNKNTDNDIVLRGLSKIGETYYTPEFEKELESKKRVSRGILYCQYNKETEEYAISYVTILVVIGSIVLDMYLLIKYTSASYYDVSIIPFLIQIMITIGFLIFGLIIHVSMVNRSLKIEQFNMNTIIGIILGIGIGFMTLLFQGFIKGIKFSVVAEDYLMFFLSVAISEEVFWRFGVQPSLKIVFNFTIFRSVAEQSSTGGGLTIKKVQNKVLTKFVSSSVAVLLTSALFMLFHIFVYDNPQDLLVVFVMGVIFGAGIEITKRADTAIIAHFIVNLIAGYSLVTQYFGGI